MIDDRLAITITHADGSVDRWGPDEPDGHDVPDDLLFSTSIPGGFKDMSCSLPRDLGVYADEALFDDVHVYGPGNETAWEGRMVQFPADGTSVKPGAVGYVAHLQDDPTAREVYVDIDYAQWTPVSAKRAHALTDTWSLSQGQVLADPVSSNPELAFEILDSWTGLKPLVSLAYDIGPGLSIGSIYYAWKRGTNLSAGDTTWVAQLILGDDDTFTANEGTPNLVAVAGPVATSFTPTTKTRRFASIYMYYNATPAGTNGWTYGLYFTSVAVYGNHGLPKQGVQTFLSNPGFLVSDIIANVVKRWGPMLNFTNPGSIEPTSFVVPHFVHYVSTTGYDIVASANAFELKDWGCYRGGEDGYPSRTFFLREPSADRLTWRARRSDGCILTGEGVQADSVVNGVVVSYSTPDKVNHQVGPPGSGCESVDALLADTDPANPVNAHGIPSRFGQLTISAVTTLAGATQLGAIWLSRRLGIQRRGTLTVVGKVKHPSGVYYPAWRVRSGDYVIVEDDPRDTTPRKIVNTNYTHKTRSNQCDLEHDAFRLDALIAQWATVSIHESTVSSVGKSVQ